MSEREQAAHDYSHTERYLKFRSVGERLGYETHFKAGWDAALESVKNAPAHD